MYPNYTQAIEVVGLEGPDSRLPAVWAADSRALRVATCTWGTISFEALGETCPTKFAEGGARVRLMQERCDADGRGVWLSTSSGDDDSSRHRQQQNMNKKVVHIADDATLSA